MCSMLILMRHLSRDVPARTCLKAHPVLYASSPTMVYASSYSICLLVHACRHVPAGEVLQGGQADLQDRSKLEWNMMAEHNSEELADHAEDEKRLESGKQFAEWKPTKQKINYAELHVAAVKRGTRTLCLIQLLEKHL